jgi:hypothetical protein
LCVIGGSLLLAEAHEDTFPDVFVALWLFAAQASTSNLRDPIDNDRIIDLTIAGCKVNATNKIR